MAQVTMLNDESEKSNPSFPLKVLILTWEYPPHIVGGLSKHVYGLSKQLSNTGAEVHVVTARTSGIQDYEVMENVHIHRVHPLNVHDDHFLSWIGGLNLAIAYKAVELAGKIPFSIIHAHDWLVGTAAVILKGKLKLPLLTTIHATEYGRNNGIHNEMQQFIHEKEKQLIEGSDQIIVCSDYMMQELILIFNTSKKKMTVIPNGVDFFQKNNEMLSDMFPTDKNRKMVFSIGRIVKEKGFDTVIEAAFLAKESKLDVFFVIAGKGPMLENYRRQIKKRQLEEYITFIGYLTDDEKNGYMNKSDINVFPSIYEPFGIVALESMVRGKPTIVSNVGGLKTIVKHKQTGLLMVPGNAESLLEQICFLVKNPKQANEIGKMGQQVAKNLYGWDRIALETRRVIEDLILQTKIKN
jgi:glycosyltransferase involved in cell wall biosynthesis